MFVPPPKTCLKCGHVRTSEDSGSSIACPQCGAVYAKVEAAMNARSTSQAPAQVRVHADPHQHERQAAAGVAHLVYLLYAIPFGLTLLVGVVLAYVMRSNGRGSFVDSHFRWQITTFWVIAGAFVVLVVLTAALMRGVFMSGSYTNALATGTFGGFFIGSAVLLLGIWVIYRIARGWYTLFRGEEI